MPEKYGVYSRTITVQDLPTSPEPKDLILEDCNIHIYDNDVYYGNGDTVEAIATTGSVLSFRHLNLSRIFFKNKVAGAISRIVIVGTYKEGD